MPTDKKDWVAVDCFTALRELSFYDGDFRRAIVSKDTTGILIKVKEGGSFRIFWENEARKGHWTELSKFEIQCMINNGEIKYRGPFGSQKKGEQHA